MTSFAPETCPKCGEEKFYKHPMPVAMPGVIKMKHSELKMEPNQSFIVRAWYCDACQYVEFKHVKEKDIEI